MATAVLAKQQGMTVLSTTRNPAKSEALTRVGADHVLIDDGNVAEQVRRILPHGADTALELVGTPTLPDTLRSVRVHGVVCFTGMLSNQWTVRDFYPIDYLPRGVRLAAYGTRSSRRTPTWKRAAPAESWSSLYNRRRPGPETYPTRQPRPRGLGPDHP